MRRLLPGIHRRIAGHVLRSIFCAALLLSAPAHAAYKAERLAELVKQRDYQEAYDYALEYRAAHEGELEFDLYYGIAAAQIGELSEAIFALERVITLEPGFDRARLELARVYFLREDDRRARQEFETVLAHDPPPAVRTQIERYLAAIQRRADRYETTTAGYFEIGAGSDSNVNAATARRGVDTVLGPVTLTEDSRELDDSFLRAEIRGSVSHPIAPGVNLIGGAGLWNRSLADEHDFETGAVDGHFGVMWRDVASRLVLSGQLERFYLDGDRYRDLFGVGASYFRIVSGDLSLDASASITQLDYDDRPELDSVFTLLDAGFSRAFPGARQPTVSAGLFIGTEDADDNTEAAQSATERDLYGFRASLWMSLAPRWLLSTGIEYSFSEYAEQNSLFNETLEEDYYVARVALDWRPAVRWRVGPELEYTDNSANIALFDYDRTEFWVRARYEFY